MTRIQGSSPGELLFVTPVAVALIVPTVAAFASTADGQGGGNRNRFNQPEDL
ncbi:MAG TPA: hypothetical protein VLU99_05310 [Nitrososphaerales archaeon]|nr:hypothetical protein [Nitrososphaerales archaeon]